MNHGGQSKDRLRAELDALLEQAEDLAEQIKQTDTPPRRARRAANPDRPKLRLIRGGKALVAVPLLWLGARVRDHYALAGATAATATVLGTGMLEAAPVPRPVVPEVPRESYSVVDPPVPVEENRSPVAPAPVATPDAAPTPQPTPPDAAPTLSPSPTPLPLDPELSPLPTPPVAEVVEPVVEVVWTKAAALAHCRDVLDVPPTRLHVCVVDLLGVDANP
ncbi:MAG: hypothetical protein ACRD0W_19165 [Acidimicrobiales bacterium]